MLKKKTKSTKSQICKTHKGMAVTKYCLTCKEKVCNVCTTDVHNLHNVTSMEEAVDLRRKSMVDTLQQSVENKSRLSNSKLKSQKAIEDTNEEEDTALRSVEGHRQTLQHAIDEHFDRFINEIKEARKDKIDALNSHVAMIVEREESIEDSELAIKNYLKLKGEVMLDQPEVELRLQDMIRLTNSETVPTICKVPVTFIVNEECINLVKSLTIGLVVTERNFLDMKIQKNNQKEPVVGEPISVLLNSHPDFAKMPITNHFQPILTDKRGNTTKLSIENDVDGKREIKFIPVAATNYTLKLQLGNGNFSGKILEIDVQPRNRIVLEIGGMAANTAEVKLHRPNDVCIASDGVYAIADRFNKRIILCNKLGQLQNEIKLLKVNEVEWRIYPHGVCVTQDGSILIADPENKVVFLCDPKGNLQNRFGTDILRFPTSVTVDIEGLVHVIDSKHNALFTFSREGELLRRIPSIEDAILTLTNPRYVCASKTGEVIVADTGNGRLLVLDTSGKPLNFIKIDNSGKSGFPVGVTVDDQGTLYVSVFQEGGDDHAILKYKMTGTLIGKVDTDETNVFARGMCLDTSFPSNVLVIADHSTNSIKGYYVE
ncbi:uncharacterized protein [Antedon mediterranea]|uniref:uncharacterized protein n=1 Tax=Antedon mediterranea TaxID=105859 RepID=UPI003AF80BB8